MSSRDKILNAISKNQPAFTALPDLSKFKQPAAGLLEKFVNVLSLIGGQVYYVDSYKEIASLVLNNHGSVNRIITRIPELIDIYEDVNLILNDAHQMQDAELAIIKAHFAVAENGAAWVTEKQMGERVLPFISQHLAVVIDAGAIVPTMHHAYELIGEATYGYGAFIAGPSKTADIEQSLVIGAHGPRSMTVFILNNL